jgi:hypothetical protein
MPKKSQRQPSSRSIRYDVVDPRDFLKFNLAYSCEHCSHYAEENSNCTLGYKVDPHLMKNQLQSYNLFSRMAFCRFLEID